MIMVLSSHLPKKKINYSLKNNEFNYGFLFRSLIKYFLPLTNFIYAFIGFDGLQCQCRFGFFSFFSPFIDIASEFCMMISILNLTYSI